MKRGIGALLFIGAVAAGVAFSSPVLRHPIVLASLARQPAPLRLSIPVAGVGRTQVTNSWGSPRPGGRGHQGVDIFAPRGRPIVSATRGIVTKVGTNRLGGNIVKVLGPGLEWHYYAHLDRYGPIRPGGVVRPGDVLGYVGNTGDARGTPYHLHYGIYSRVGVAQNPYARLAR